MFWNTPKKIRKQDLEEEVKQTLKLYTQLSQEYMLWLLSNKNQIYLTDLKSKFGTWVLETSPFELKFGIENYIQIGRTLLNLWLLKK